MLFLETQSTIQGDINTLINQIVTILKTLYNIILVAVPIIMLVLGTIDLIKAVTSGDEKDIKAAVSLLGKRMIYGVGTFLVLVIVQTVVVMVNGDSDWSMFWNGGSSGSKNELTIACPAEIKSSDTVNVIVGEITANRDFSECNVPSGYEFVRTGGSSGKLKRTSPDSSFPISELIITVKDSDGNSAECRVKINK